MQGKDFILSKLENILKSIEADQTELVYVFNDNQLTRFANNYIHQNLAENNAELTIKIVKNKRYATININSFEPEIVSYSVQKLKEILDFQPDDPDFISLPGFEPYPEIETFDKETAYFSPVQRAEKVKIITDLAEKNQVESSGHFTNTMRETAVVNSLGIRAYNASTSSELLSVVHDNKVEGFSISKSDKISKIDTLKVAEESVGKCIRSKNPLDVEPGVYPVIMEAYGVSQLLEYLCMENFNAKDFYESKSCISGKLNEKITGENITISNDPRNPDCMPLPFDMEGLPVKKTVLIEKGIAKAVVHNSYTANKTGQKSTGNKASPGYKTPVPLNVVMDGGNDSIEKMIESTEKGIYVTRLNYINIVSQKKTIHTGLTRSGTFLIENGKIVSPIYNLRFTESILKLLSNVSMLSKERQLGGEMFLNVLAPALKTDSFRFTEKTKHE